MSAAADFVIRNALLAFLRSASAGPWTTARIAALRQAYLDDGLSFGLIARRLGVSRNAVMGKVYRLKWKRDDGPRRAIVHRHLIERRGRPARKPAPPTIEQIDQSGGVALGDLGACHCRFPLGETASGWRFCGEPKRAGSSYCEGHHRVCYKKAPKQGKVASC